VDQNGRRTCREAKEKAGGDLAKLLAGVKITISQKAGEQEQLFGSVTQDVGSREAELPLTDADPSR
jgi:ribosomal protein L9